MPVKRRTVKKTSNKRASKTARKYAKKRNRKSSKQKGGCGCANAMNGGTAFAGEEAATNGLNSIPEHSIIPFQGGNQLAPSEQVGENTSMPGGGKTKKQKKGKYRKSKRTMKGGNIFNPYSPVISGISELVNSSEDTNMPIRNDGALP